MTGSRCHIRLSLGVLCTLLLFAASPVRAQQAGVETSLDRRQIYAGESVVYTVEVVNAEGARAPVLTGMDAFVVRSLGGPQSSQVTQFINGRRTHSFSEKYQYQLTPRRTGLLTIPSPRVNLHGKTLAGRVQELNVLLPEDQDVTRLQVSVQPPRVYPLQPFTVSLKIFVRVLPAPFSTRDPISVTAGDPPRLRIPWEDPPEGLQGEDRNAWLAPKLAQSQRIGRRRVKSGFAINQIPESNNNPFSLFESRFERRYAVFDLAGRRATEDDLEGVPEMRGRAGEYWVYTLDREMTALRSGRFAFGPVSLKGLFASAVDASDDLVGERIYARAKAVDLVVKEVPTTGRPDSYTGAIGHWSIAAEAAPTALRVGDPLTLTLTVSGAGNLEGVQAPDLAALESFTTSFKVYEATSETVGSTRVFTYGLRPITAMIAELPSVPFSYFDVESGLYRTVHTEPVPLRVQDAERLDTRKILTTPSTLAADSSLAASSSGLFGNISDARQLRREVVSWQSCAGYVGSLVATYGMLGLLLGRHRRHREDPARRRRRGATNLARKRSQQARQALAEGQEDQGLSTALLGLTGLVAAAAGVPEAGVTRRDAQRLLEGLTIDPKLIQDTQSLLDAFETRQYGQGGDAVALQQRAAAHGDALISALRKGGHLS